MYAKSSTFQHEFLVHKQAHYYNIVHLINIYEAGYMNSL